jgi:hypothetical protein
MARKLLLYDQLAGEAAVVGSARAAPLTSITPTQAGTQPGLPSWLFEQRQLLNLSAKQFPTEIAAPPGEHHD